MVNHSNRFDPTISGIGFCWSAHKAYYLDLSEEQADKLNRLKTFFESYKTLVGQHLKTALKSLALYHIQIKGSLFDNLIAHYLINPDMRHEYSILSETYLNLPIKAAPKGDFSTWSIAEKCEQLCQNADVGLQLHQHFSNELKRDNLRFLFDTLEMPLLRVLAKMEQHGIRLDIPFLEGLSLEFGKQIEALEREIYEQAGVTFNIASPK